MAWTLINFTYLFIFLKGFIIYYKSVESDDMKQVELSGDKSSYLFKGLKCGTRYQYYIIAFNEIGKSDPSNVVSVVTEGSGI